MSDQREVISIYETSDQRSFLDSMKEENDDLKKLNSGLKDEIKGMSSDLKMAKGYNKSLSVKVSLRDRSYFQIQNVIPENTSGFIESGE